MPDPKFTVSGIRGHYPSQINESLLAHISTAYAKWNPGAVFAVGGDTRFSTHVLKKTVIQTLLAFGKQVVDIGVLPTPSVQVYVGEKKLAGGLMITASHNPGSDNGIKLISSQGLFLNATEVDEIKKTMMEIEPQPVPSANASIGFSEDPEAYQVHLNKVLECFDVESIAKHHFKVVLDPVNGAGIQSATKLLKTLGCELTLIHQKPQGDYEREPEPRPENLTALIQKVKETKADLGFALDVDADRLAIIDEQGKPLGEDLTLCLVIDKILSMSHQQKNKVVTNLSTTRTVKDLCQRYGAELIETPVGEIHVSQQILEQNAVVGGEGNGGVIYPKVGYGRDSLSAMAWILQILTDAHKPASQLSADMPQYFMHKEKLQRTDAWVSKQAELKAAFKNAQLDSRDGLKFSFEDSWIHLRESNTEPILRLIAEARTEAQLQSLIQKTKEILVS